MNIVLLGMGPTPPGEGLLTGVTALQGAGSPVSLVSRRPPAPDLAAHLEEVHALPRGRLSGLSGRQPPGPLRRLRVDPDRLPGAVRLLRDATIRGLLDRADVLVAVDQAAIPAVWLAARRRPGLVVLSGLPAAVSRWAR